MASSGLKRWMTNAAVVTGVGAVAAFAWAEGREERTMKVQERALVERALKNPCSIAHQDSLAAAYPALRELKAIQSAEWDEMQRKNIAAMDAAIERMKAAGSDPVLFKRAARASDEARNEAERTVDRRLREQSEEWEMRCQQLLTEPHGA